MKSTTRMMGGFKAARTRHYNLTRQKAMNKLREIAKTEGYMLPAILQCEEGVELAFDLGGGRRFIKFNTREKALDYIVSLFSCC